MEYTNDGKNVQSVQLGGESVRGQYTSNHIDLFEVRVCFPVVRIYWARDRTEELQFQRSRNIEPFEWCLVGGNICVADVLIF
uniref:9K protein n=1 Tax=Tobacco rattle virus TaxID=12295 RepID=A0A1D8QM81_9VIRU|nr:9K protein [Tobacco rattle virus]AOW42050.1 9K protein [Tobacco rattle virus]